MKIKTERVNSELARQISRIIANEIKDPRLGECLVGVTRVSTTPDLKYAKVYLSVFASDAARREEAFSVISHSKGFIRNRLKDAVQIRLLPELTFLIDDSVDYGMKIENLLAQINIPEQDGEND